MVFVSTTFIFVFLPVYFLGYYLLKKNTKKQNYWILIGSLLFYSWGGAWALFCLIISIILNFIWGILIENSTGIRRNLWMSLAVAFNLLNLIVFKYFNFIVDVIFNLIGLFDIKLTWNVIKMPLPIGVSFYTFQIISYIIDVYNEKVKAQRSIVNLGVYVALFPQLIAGPIVRYVDIEHEINNRDFDLCKIGDGLERFIRGMAKKLIIADVMGNLADYSFNHMAYDNTIVAWMGAVAYSLQIYYDFSAYSDMAIGMGKMMGFHFQENFQYPYISLSIREFWRRWHISLSSWFRDYLYIPLGGSRTGKTYRNLLIVFCVTGLWHGASWNFVVWGLWHGFFVILERKTGTVLKKTPKIMKWIYTFLIVEIGWVFFRANTLLEAIQYLKIMFLINYHNNMYIYLNLDWQIVITFVLAVFLCYPLFSFTYVKCFVEKIRGRWAIIRYVGYLLLYLICISFICGTKSNPFIYFKF